VGEALFIALYLLIGIGLPVAVVALNAVALGRTARRGLNVKCAIAAFIFGIAWLISVGSRPLFMAGSDYVRFTLLGSSLILSIVSATIALIGMYEIRRRPGRWTRGWKRAIWSFWMGILNMCGIAAFCYLATHPDKLERVWRSVY
jgi:hypothetical protein